MRHISAAQTPAKKLSSHARIKQATAAAAAAAAGVSRLRL